MVARIKEVIEVTNIRIEIICTKGYTKITIPYNKDPDSHLMIICHKNAERVRIECYNKSEIHNIRYFSRYVLRYNNILILRNIKEAICIIDVKKQRMNILNRNTCYHMSSLMQ